MSVVKYRLRLFGRLVAELEIESEDMRIHIVGADEAEGEDSGDPEPLRWAPPPIEDPPMEGHLVWGAPPLHTNPDAV